MSLHAAFVVVYLLALIGVGAWKARKVKSQEDFSLAGRGLSTVVLVGTLLATWIGTGSIFGNAQESYEVGFAAFVLPISGALGIIALYLLAFRIRTFGQFTIQDILEARFGVATRIMGTVTLLLAYVIIVSRQYNAGSAVIVRMIPELDPAMATLGVALFVILYTALAGMYSVAYTDVANGVLMALGLAFALPFLWSAAGGAEGVRESLSAEQLDVFGHYGPFALISVLLPSFLLLIGDANMYQRFFSARSPAAARRSAVLMFFGVVVLECAIIAVAVLGAAIVSGDPDVAAPENSGHIVVHLAFEVLPDFLGAMLVATVVAVVVSTADSYLLSPATSLVRDVYQRFVNPVASETHIVLVGRLLVVALGLVALALSFGSDEFFRVALFAYTIYGAGITPVLLAAFFWRRATAPAAFASMATGVLTSVGWKFGLVDGGLRLAERYGDELPWLASVDAVIPAFTASVLVLVVVSLATPPPTEAQSRAI